MMLLAAFAAGSLSFGASAASGGLAGSWSGGGWVSFSSGSRDRARCRVTYTPQSASTYAINAFCATASGSVSQSAILHRVGENTYTGSFYNDQFNVSGRIHVVVRGGTQSVTLSGSAGSAYLSLSR